MRLGVCGSEACCCGWAGALSARFDEPVVWLLAGWDSVAEGLRWAWRTYTIRTSAIADAISMAPMNDLPLDGPCWAWGEERRVGLAIAGLLAEVSSVNLFAPAAFHREDASAMALSPSVSFGVTTQLGQPIENANDDNGADGDYQDRNHRTYRMPSRPDYWPIGAAPLMARAFWSDSVQPGPP